MYGVPVDLDVNRFRGATLVQIAVGTNEVQFNFQPRLLIGVEGLWELRDSNNRVIDRAQPNHEREVYRVRVLLGRAVVNACVNAPRSFVLEFDGGYRLEVFDSSEQYESFSIQPGDIFV